MRAVVSLVAAAALLAPPPWVEAAPPEDVAAYCSAMYPQAQFQRRCVALEQAAAERIALANPDPEQVSRCRSSSPSWSVMERCLAEASRSSAASTAGGSTGAGPVARPGGTATDPDAPTAAGGAPAPGAAKASAPTLDVRSPSTVILGPQPAASAPPERERQTRTISEADADRQLRGVLEREGRPGARCTKKQYGPGWVTICE